MTDEAGSLLERVRHKAIGVQMTHMTISAPSYARRPWRIAVSVLIGAMSLSWLAPHVHADGSHPLEATLLHSASAAPLALAAAGAAAQASNILVSLDAESELALSLHSASLALENAERTLGAARRESQQGGMTAERLAALAAAEQAYAAALAHHRAVEQDVQDAVLSATEAALGTENAALAARVAANSSRAVPDAWKALDLSEPAWATLERAWFKASRGASASLTDAEQQALAAAQSSPLVQVVEARLTANLAAVEGAWLQALQQAQGGQ